MCLFCHRNPQAVTQQLRLAEELACTQAAAAAREAEIMKERHLSDAKSWALDRSSLESQLANQRHEAAAAAAASLESVDQLHAKVRSQLVQTPRTYSFLPRGCF